MYFGLCIIRYIDEFPDNGVSAATLKWSQDTLWKLFFNLKAVRV